MRAHPLLLIAGLLLVAVLAVLVMLWGVGVIGSPTQQSGAGKTALAYVHTRMVWYAGPSVTSTRVVPLDQLEPALRAAVPAHIQEDVNVSDLIHRYGPHRKVALVVLSGEYNSLPPDEGVIVQGQMVAIVDMPTNRVLLLTD